MRKFFLLLIVAITSGCAHRIVIVSSARPDVGIRAAPNSQAYRPDAVLFENPVRATQARCALFLGRLNRQDILVPTGNGGIGLVQPPLVVFEVGIPMTVSGSRQAPGTLTLVGLQRDVHYSYLCTMNRFIGGGTSDIVFGAFRLYGGLLRDQYRRPSHLGTRMLVDYVNHVERLHGQGGYANSRFDLAVDVNELLARAIGAIRH